MYTLQATESDEYERDLGLLTWRHDTRVLTDNVQMREQDIRLSLDQEKAGGMSN